MAAASTRLRNARIAIRHPSARSNFFGAIRTGVRFFLGWLDGWLLVVPWLRGWLRWVMGRGVAGVGWVPWLCWPF
jgi:hypothetical protein